MANICFTHYVLECEDKSKLQRIHDAITYCNSPEYPKPKDGSHPSWTSNILAELLMEHQPDRSWWVESDLVDGILHIYEESAWTRGVAINQLLGQMNDPEDEENNIEVYFYTEEPGCEIYESNDDYHCHFYDEYVLDTSEDKFYYDSFQSLLEGLGAFVGDTLLFDTFGEVEKYLEGYNETHQEDEKWAYAHAIDYTASIYY